MKFSLNWLREFVELPDDTAQLAHLLTFAGVEVEAIETRGADFEKVVVAQITASAQHPNADRLSVCTVDDGSGESRQIVCGAKNYKVGDKVPLALPGAILPNDLRIRASKVRGVESQGMLCSAKELGIAEDAAGLLILSPDAPLGAPIGKLFPSDTVIEVEITPNRGDLLSHFGLAREIAALTGKPLRDPPLPLPPATVVGAGVKISAPRECPFFSLRRIENVRVGPSPQWLLGKVEGVGLRSINNIVDISNFVMLELGQPTHAFDAGKLKGGINVRLARAGEELLALDGKKYSLTGQNVVVADEERAVGIAGVMGGEETGVSESTQNILLESAWFLPASVRRTARQLNLSTDASYRFERRVDPEMVLRASARAAELIRQIAGGEPQEETLVAGSLPAPPAGFSLRYRTLNDLAGTPVDPSEADSILERFGLEKLGATEEQATWRIPSYRADLRRQVDLIEEVVRVFGIDRIPSADRSRFTPMSEADRVYDFEMQLRRQLTARGFSEARTSALVSRESLGESFVGGAVELRNPLSEDHVALRSSLIPGLLGALERNIRNGATSVRLFELGRVFLPHEGREIRRLGLLLWGEAVSRPHWRSGQARALDFFDAKGALESLGGELSLRRIERPQFALAAEISVGGKPMGIAGQLSSRYDAAGRPTIVAEIDLPKHAELTMQSRFEELARFPSVTRDIAMFASVHLTHEEIVETIASAGEPLLANVELFDLFSGKTPETSGTERRSLAYSLTYRDKTGTLKGEQVTAAHDRIRERLKRELAVELRE